MPKIKETLRAVFFYNIDSPAGSGISSLGKKRYVAIYFIKKGKARGVSFSQRALQKGEITAGLFPDGRVKQPV